MHFSVKTEIVFVVKNLGGVTMSVKFRKKHFRKRIAKLRVAGFFLDFSV